MTHENTCLVCDSLQYEPFFEMNSTPVNVGAHWPTAEAAKGCARGDISLAFCRNCGFIGNQVFDESLLDYSGEYDNSLSFSPYYQAYARGLAEHLIERYKVRHKTVVEIGCGKGEFLRLLCEMGDNRAVGFDPTFTAGVEVASEDDRITFIRDHYSAKYAKYQGDLVCCRHVFEHVARPRPFLDRKSTRLNSSHIPLSRMPSSA